MLTKVNYKIVLVGDSAVGKTCVATRYVSDDFYEFQEPTIGASFMTKKVETNDKEIRFEIWDTAGQEKFQALRQISYFILRSPTGAGIFLKGQKMFFE